MAKNLSPAVRRELANLKDADSQKSAMKALKSYVKDLDSKAIPLFLEQVSETKETGSLSGEYTISLYEVLARYHGVNIVPQIDSIMVTIVKTLASSAGSFPLQQACSKVVPAIARYGIDPTTPEKRKTHIIDCLCKPLAESLLGNQESLTSGSALCLTALVESDNWKFASDEMVNKVCLNVAAALEERSTQTNSHMGLAMALAKHNSLTVEAYARLLIQSGLRILNVGRMVESNSQKRLAAIHMVNFLMKSLDHRSVYSELELITKEMDKCQTDQMAFIKGAAYEALETATRISKEKELKFDKESSSMTTGSNCSNNRSNNWGCGDQSSSCVSPESQTLGSFLEYDSPIGTPVSSRPVSPSSSYDMRSVNYNNMPWRYPNGGVDVSLKDGLFSEISNGNGFRENSEHSKHCDSNCNGGRRRHSNDFMGFQHPSSNNKRSLTPSPPQSRSQIDVDNIRIFTTPRKLIHSLQGVTNSEAADKKNTGGFRSSCSSVCNWSPLRKYDEKDGFSFTNNGEGDSKENGSPSSGHHKEEQFVDVAEEESAAAAYEEEEEEEEEEVIRAEKKEVVYAKTLRRRVVPLRLICSLFLLIISVFTSLLWLDGQHQDVVHLVPT